MTHSHTPAARLPRRAFLRNLGIGATACALAPQLLARTAPKPTIALGIDVLAANGFRPLRGRRVGLLSHPAGVNRLGVSTIDVLRRAPQVNLVALFGPEHGIYGNEKANVPVDDKIDPATGLPVFSLYGKFRRPTATMLQHIDTLVIDLQDIGARSYTYISCMRYCIEEAFRHEVEVIVLDRPNPLGGLLIDGPFLDPQWMSYVGAFQMPYVHGLTIGEIARWAHHAPGVLDIDAPLRRKGKLSVIAMQGWHRHMRWPDTGLRWIPTSPAIPDVSAAVGYPLTGLGCQLGSFSHGYGTPFPFRLIRHPDQSPTAIANAFTQRNIPGLAFKTIRFAHHNATLEATYIALTDWRALQPTELSLHMMQQACTWQRPNPFAAAPKSQADLFLKHFGDSEVFAQLASQPNALNFSAILKRWQRRNHQWAAAIQPFRLYT